MFERFFEKPRREVDTLEEAIHYDLRALLAENFADFTDLVQAARKKSTLRQNGGFFCGPLQHKMVRHLSQKDGFEIIPEVAEVILKYVVGEGLALRIEPYKKEETKAE